jgi:shikimate kinase
VLSSGCYNSRVTPSNNIFLVGMMGAGKTTVGRALARRLARSFVDSDQEIETKTGVRISVIFDIEGEAGFRRREAEALERLTAMDNLVLATGGGAVLQAQNRECLRTRGCVIYLHGQPKDLWLRTRNDRTRPLLQTEDPRARLEQMYVQRDPLYREVADLVVDTGRQSASVLVGALLPRLEEICNLSA